MENKNCPLLPSSISPSSSLIFVSANLAPKRRKGGKKYRKRKGRRTILGLFFNFFFNSWHFRWNFGCFISLHEISSSEFQMHNYYFLWFFRFGFVLWLRMGNRAAASTTFEGLYWPSAPVFSSVPALLWRRKVWRKLGLMDFVQVELPHFSFCEY